MTVAQPKHTPSESCQAPCGPVRQYACLHPCTLDPTVTLAVMQLSFLLPICPGFCLSPPASSILHHFPVPILLYLQHEECCMTESRRVILSTLVTSGKNKMYPVWRPPHVSFVSPAVGPSTAQTPYEYSARTSCLL